LWALTSRARFAFDTIIPIHVKDVFHWDSTAAGLIFITVMVPGFLAPFFGILSDRFGAKWPALFGFVASIPLFVCLRFIIEDSLSQKVLLCVLLTLLGVTLFLSNTPLMAEITYAIDDKDKRHPGIWGERGVYGIAYGLFTTAFALGGTIGSIMSGEIVANSGWEPATWSLAIWYSAAVPVVAIWVGRRLGKPSKQSAPNVQSEDVEAAISQSPAKRKEDEAQQP
jgi:nitrate/nitrite transporter NarK